jgi:hypothetical protein
LKSKITYGLLTTLSLGGLYLGLRFAFGLFTPFNSWTAHQDIKNGKIRIIELGELPLNHRQRIELANSFGFDIYYYGCNLTRDIINGTAYYNQTIIEHLEKKHGSSWWTNFQMQLDSITKKDSIEYLKSKVIEIVLRETIVKEKIHLIDSISHGSRHLIFLAEPSLNAGYFYSVKVIENDGVKTVTHHNFLVDINTLQVVNPDGKLPGL